MTPSNSRKASARSATRLKLISAFALAALGPLSVGSAFAASFTISSNSTSAQTLSASQTGTINAGKSLTVSGSTVAVTITGNNATLTNLGTLSQTGTGRAIRDNTGVTGLTITNGSTTNSFATMVTADADVIQMNKSPASVTLNNYGIMTSNNASAGGAQVVDFNAILSGSNIVNNYAGGVMTAYEADSVRPGVNGVVNNWGTIKSITNLGNSSDGIDAQTNTGVQVVNTGLVEGGRHGITGGNADSATTDGTFAMSVTNNLGGAIQGDNGSGINIDGFNAKEVVTIVNAGTITGNGHNIGDGNSHDGDGVDVDGLVNLTNSGTIKSINAYGGPVVNGVQPIEYSEGVTVGGGTIINTGLIEGSIASGNTTAIGRGITIAGVDKTVVNGVETAVPVQAPYAATTISNSGTIKGDSDSAIIFSSGLASGFSHTINNQAGGLIQTGSTTAPAILTAADNVTINNAGSIDGSSSGKAITGGSGSLTLNITGGQASIIGDISGGVGGTNNMKLDLGAGNSFTYSGTITNFASVELDSGTFILNGTAAGSALNLNGGAFGIANSQSFASLSLVASSSIDLGSKSLTFNGLGSIGSGTTLTIQDYLVSASPDYAFRLNGDFTGNADFLRLLGETTLNGAAVTAHFDGTYTDVVAAPVPEANSYALIAVGLGLVGFLARRRKTA